MLIVDTSVWSDHLRRFDGQLAQLLDAGLVLVHPFVVGELACSLFPKREQTLEALNSMPAAPVLSQAELLGFIDRQALAGIGIGFIDIHLLASALVAQAGLWTRDKRLAKAAAQLGLVTELAV